MLRKLFVYLLRFGVGFYFAYPAIQSLMSHPATNFSKSIYQCVNTFYPQFAPNHIWIAVTVFLIILGAMIAFWKKPMSWIVFGIVVLGFKLATASVWSISMIMQTVPVLLVCIALAIYYWQE